MAESVNGNMLTDVERQRIRQRLTRDQKPSTQLSSSYAIQWGDVFEKLGQPFDTTSIPLSKLHQMRRDPMIAFGLLFVKVPLIRAPWYIKAGDKNGPRPDVACVIDNALRDIYARFVFQYCNSLDYGYSAIVKRFKLMKPPWTYLDVEAKDGQYDKLAWDEGGINALVWDTFHALPPDDAQPHWTRRGEFNGIIYRRAEQPAWMQKEEGPNRADVPADWALWVTNEKDSVFGSLWGYPRTGYAYPYWWSYWFRWALADRHFEKDADPAMVIYYPPTEEGYDVDGNVIDYRALALQIGEAARSGSTIALPATLVEGLDGKQTNSREWEITTLQNVNNFAAFNEPFTYLDVAKLRSIMVPEQAFLEGRGGTSSRNVAETLGDVFFSSQAVLMEEIDSHINRFMIPQLIEANYPPDEEITAVKVTRGFQQTDVELGRQVIQLIGQTDPSSLDVDLRELLSQYGLPLKSPKQMAKEESDLDAEAGKFLKQQGDANAKPPADEKAGVTLSGQYYKPREVIYLSQELPPSVHYEDPAIVRLIAELRDEWVDEYGKQYDYAANTILAEGNNIELGVSDAVTRLLGKMVQTPAAAAAATNRVAGWLMSVMDIAGRRELARLNVKDAVFDMENPEIVQWSQQRAAQLVRNVNETTREELRKFLTEQLDKTQSPHDIADAIRTKFGKRWHSWKAERIARTEAQMAYNWATLQAYKQEGITQVIAHDAAIPSRSDPDCIARDGQVFDIDDAWVEQLKEHPNGTLGWSPVVNVPQLEVALVDEIPTGELATFDQDSGQITFRRDIDPMQRRDFIQAVREVVTRPQSVAPSPSHTPRTDARRGGRDPHHRVTPPTRTCRPSCRSSATAIEGDLLPLPGRLELGVWGRTQELLHPRWPKGTPLGGQWKSRGDLGLPHVENKTWDVGTPDGAGRGRAKRASLIQERATHSISSRPDEALKNIAEYKEKKAEIQAKVDSGDLEASMGALGMDLFDDLIKEAEAKAGSVSVRFKKREDLKPGEIVWQSEDRVPVRWTYKGDGVLGKVDDPSYETNAHEIVQPELPLGREKLWNYDGAVVEGYPLVFMHEGKMWSAERVTNEGDGEWFWAREVGSSKKTLKRFTPETEVELMSAPVMGVSSSIDFFKKVAQNQDAHLKLDAARSEAAHAWSKHIDARLSEIVGVKSNWNGHTKITQTTIPALGRKLWDCSVMLDGGPNSPNWTWPDTKNMTTVGYTSLIHEHIHAISMGSGWGDYDPFMYRDYMRYEEAVVEGLTRQIRSQMLPEDPPEFLKWMNQRDHVTGIRRFDQLYWTRVDRENGYHQWVQATDTIADMVGKSRLQFYIELIKEPPVRRRALIEKMAKDTKDPRVEKTVKAILDKVLDTKKDDKPLNNAASSVLKKVDVEFRPATEDERKALKIPPAWTDVYVTDHPTNPLRAFGRDSKGRTQRRYSAEFIEANKANKFARLAEFDKARDGILAATERDTSDSAMVVRLIALTGIRPGSTKDTGGDVKAYGATTLLKQHVTLNGDKVELDFIGKEGVQNHFEVEDTVLATWLRDKMALIKDGDEVFNASDQSARKWMAAHGGAGFLLKDFRTWLATAVALDLVQKTPPPPPSTKREYEKWRKAIATQVSKLLNNTPAMALSSYINPAVWDQLPPRSA